MYMCLNAYMCVLCMYGQVHVCVHVLDACMNCVSKHVIECMRVLVCIHVHVYACASSMCVSVSTCVCVCVSGD